MAKETVAAIPFDNFLKSSSMFDNSRLKIDRAKEHVSNFNAELTAFIGRNPYKVVSNKDPETNSGGLKAEQVETVPLRFSAIIGDAIHNLRTALDLMACDLVVRYGGTTDDVHFPFADSPIGLEKQIKKRKINQTVPQVVDLMRRLKPYIGGNKPLRGLHDLDVMDKHYGIIAVLGDAYITWGEGWTEHIVLEGQPISYNRNELLTSGPLKHGEPVAGFPIVRGGVKGEWYPPIVQVVFKEGAFKGQPIFPTLLQLTEMVEGIIKAFEPYG